jgi:hypothetical protein
MPDPLAPELCRWVAGTETGISSLTIFETLGGRWVSELERWGRSPPSDPSDFARCRKLLLLAPGWRTRLPEVAERWPEWRPFVEAWDEMERLFVEESPSGRCPRLFELMTRLGRGRSAA